ncbi:hypothetical protein EON62_01425, partial [archaeon]
MSFTVRASSQSILTVAMWAAFDSGDAAAALAAVKAGADFRSTRVVTRTAPRPMTSLGHHHHVHSYGRGVWPPAEVIEESGPTPLFFAASKGWEAVVDALCEAGTPIEDSVRSAERTPLQEAIANGHGRVVRVFMRRGAAITTPNKDGTTALHWAAEAGRATILATLAAGFPKVDIMDERGRTPLMVAAGKSKVVVAATLLLLGADVELQDFDGRTPLFEAAECGTLDIVKFFVGAGADVNSSSNRGATPLHAAVRRGESTIVALLLSLGANPRAITSVEWNSLPAGTTPIDIARTKGLTSIGAQLKEAAATRKPTLPLSGAVGPGAGGTGVVEEVGGAFQRAKAAALQKLSSAAAKAKTDETTLNTAAELATRELGASQTKLEDAVAWVVPLAAVAEETAQAAAEAKRRANEAAAAAVAAQQALTDGNNTVKTLTNVFNTQSMETKKVLTRRDLAVKLATTITSFATSAQAKVAEEAAALERQRKIAEEISSASMFTADPVCSSVGARAGAGASAHAPDAVSCRLDVKDIKFERDEDGAPLELGSGTFGTVYAATWRGEPVAAKKLRPALRKESLPIFWREVTLAVATRHAHVV